MRRGITAAFDVGPARAPAGRWAPSTGRNNYPGAARSERGFAPRRDGVTSGGLVIDGRTVPIQQIAPAPRPGQVGASTFRVGERVFHQKFGYGRVKAVDGNRLEIAFDKAGTKKVIDSFVAKA